MGVNFFSSMSGILWSFWRREPPHPPGAPMRHAGALTCSEQEAPCYRPVCQGGGAEAKAAGGGGNAGYYG